MFRPLLNNLYDIYQGSEIYLPDAVYDLVKTWMCAKDGRSPRHVITLIWKGKKILPFDEDKIVVAYQSTPIHVPERILEKSIVIETSMESTEPEPVKEEPKQEKPRHEPQRFGRRTGTKKKPFNHLF